MSQVFIESAIGMLTAGMSNRAVARECNGNLSTISYLQRDLREFGSTSNRPHNRRPHAWCHVGERFADINIVNRVPHGYGMSYGQQAQLHFINGNLNAQRYRDGPFLSLSYMFLVIFLVM